MRPSFVLCLLLALVPVARADLIPGRPAGPVSVDKAEAPEAGSSGEAWLPTALVGLGIGALVVLLLSLSRRDPSKKEGTP